VPDHPCSETHPVAAARIRIELEALFDSDRQLHASLEALREELRVKHERELKKPAEPPHTWLDSDKLQPCAERISKVLVISTYSILLLSAAFCFIRLAMAKPLPSPGVSAVAAAAAGATPDE